MVDDTPPDAVHDAVTSPDDWYPDHPLCAGSERFFAHGCEIQVGRVLRDTHEDRFVAVKDVDERDRIALLLEVIDDGGDFSVPDDADAVTVQWHEEGGRFIPV